MNRVDFLIDLKKISCTNKGFKDFIRCMQSNVKSAETPEKMLIFTYIFDTRAISTAVQNHFFSDSLLFLRRLELFPDIFGEILMRKSFFFHFIHASTTLLVFPPPEIYR